MNGERIVNKHDRVLQYIDILLPLQEKIESIITLKNSYQTLLLEPRLLFKHRKSFICFLIALRLYNKYKASSRLAKEFIDNSISEIAKYDGEFAGQVKALMPTFDNKRWIFAELMEALGHGRQYFISYISTHLMELNAKAKSIADTKSSKQLVTLFSIISGHEVDYLMRYRSDCDNWVNVRYAISYDINFYIKRINLYLRGGFEGNTRYLGIVNDFGDVELAKNILKNPQIRNLWRYNEQVKYLNLLIGLCKKSETSGEWEGFWGKRFLGEKGRKNGEVIFFRENDEEVGFWGKKGDEKGENFDKHADLFETKYGNADFKEILMAKKGGIGESPEGWGGIWQGNRLVRPGFLHILLARLQHPSYQRQKIIFPASQELHKVLVTREKGLNEQREESANKLIELLERIRGIGLSREKVLSRFKGLLKRKKRLILKKLGNDINEFASKSRIFASYEEYIKNLNVVSKIEREFMMPRIDKSGQISIKNLIYVFQQISSDDYLNDIGKGVLVGGSEKAAQTAWLQRIMLIKLEHLTEEDFKKMRNLIEEAKELLAELNQIYIDISANVKEEYLLGINDLQNIGFIGLEGIKNKEWEFGYVKRVLKEVMQNG